MYMLLVVKLQNINCRTKIAINDKLKGKYL